MNNMSKPFRIKDRLRSFVYAWRGVCCFLREEHNARIHCAAVVVVTAAGFFFGITRQEWMAVIFCFAAVLASEAFNTAIEMLVSIVSEERRPALGKIKDVAAGAVLICVIGAVIVGVMVFAPYIF